MARFSLIGGDYPPQSQAPNASAERTFNWQPELVPSPNSKTQMMLIPTPGTKRFATIAGNSVRGGCEFNGRSFAIGDKFNEIFADGTKQEYGTLTNDGKLAQIEANQANQLLISSGGSLWTFDLAANTLTAVANPPFSSVISIDFDDGYFFALQANSNSFALSASLDGTTWSGINIGKPSVFADNIVAAIVDHREIALLGRKRSVFLYDSGNTFPFDVVPGGYMEQGCASTFAVCRYDNTFGWLGADERGQGIAWKAQGYNPVRVSTHSQEYLWATYPRIDDAISYSYQDSGHTIWHLYFPSGLNDRGEQVGASFRYDVSTGLWHQPTYWDGTNGRHMAHRSQCHWFAFGKHLVGDPQSGNIYEMRMPLRNGQAWDFCDDDGNPIMRERIAPPISMEANWIFGKSIQIDLETGLTPGFDGTLGATLLMLASPSFLWTVRIDDSGILRTDKTAVGNPTDYFFRDITANNWELLIDDNGLLSTEASDTDGDPSLQMVSTSGTKYFTLSVDQVGDINVIAAGTVTRGAQLTLDWSDDGGHNYSNPVILDCGKIGEYKKRVKKNRLGRWRARNYRIRGIDPVPYRIIDGYIEATPGFGPTERLASQLRKEA